MKTLAVLSQKGGVGKSTIARLMATAYAGVGWRVKLADFHTKQLARVDWAGERLRHGVQPEVPAEAFPNVKKALTQQTQYDLMVFDGKLNLDAITLEIARESDLIVIPAQVSLDDLEPQVRFAHELLQRGVERADILFVLNLTLDSAASINDAKGYIQTAGYRCATTDLPIKTGYQLAQNQGRAINESQYPSLNERADALAQEIIDRFTELAGIKRGSRTSRLPSPPPPSNDEKPAGRLADFVPARGEAPQNMTAPDGKAWHDLSFKVTRAQIGRFRLEATKREMKQKDLLLAMWAHYNDTYPVPER